MKTIPFYKMQGAGNDYIYINVREEMIDNPEWLAVKISDRHFGVGSDGLVLIMNSTVADFRMRMFNADGSESGMCGNAVRCIGKYVYEKKLTDKTVITLETMYRQICLRKETDGQNRDNARNRLRDKNVKIDGRRRQSGKNKRRHGRSPVKSGTDSRMSSRHDEDTA